MPQYQIPQPHPPIEGLKQGFLFPQLPPPPREIGLRQIVPHTRLPFEGPSGTSPQSYVFGQSQPQFQRSYTVLPKVVPRSGAAPLPNTAHVLPYPNPQPLARARLWKSALRIR